LDLVGVSAGETGFADHISLQIPVPIVAIEDPTLGIVDQVEVGLG
jgi:hypothetical protein